jgi:hypothetical protein
MGIRQSPARLPVFIARAICEAGESGMGYTLFTLVFSDGRTQAYVAGNVVDFVTFPPGKTAADVVSVIPHRGRNENPQEDLIPHEWCLHGVGGSQF